jgi:hypothetical protein
MQTTWEFLNPVLGLGVEPKNLTFFQISLRGFIVFAAALVKLRMGDRRALLQKTAFDAVLIVPPHRRRWSSSKRRVLNLSSGRRIKQSAMRKPERVFALAGFAFWIRSGISNALIRFTEADRKPFSHWGSRSRDRRGCRWCKFASYLSDFLRFGSEKRDNYVAHVQRRRQRLAATVQCHQAARNVCF